MKTSELSGTALDWAVAKAEGFVDRLDLTPWEFLRYREDHDYEPSTAWAQGGPIIERERVSIRYAANDARGAWYAVLGPNRFLSPDYEGSGPTPLIAAMRCYLASKLGDEVEVPNELKGE